VRLSPVAALLVLVLAGCASDGPARGSTSVEAAPARTTGAAAALTRDAELQAGLSELLVERVHLAALSGPVAEAAVEDVDEALAELAGPAAAGTLREALAEADSAGTSWAEQRRAAERARLTARLLSADVAADAGRRAPDGRAALLRADLTGLLVEHVGLVVGLAREQAALGREPSADVSGVREALAGNAEDLADVLGAAYPAVRPTFLASWSAHVDRLDRYAAVRAGGGAGPAEVAAVRGYPLELARLLAEHVTGLPAETAAAELEPALSALLAAVDVAAGRAPGAVTAQRQAVARVLPAAALAASAVAEDLDLT
jgi:hypothetical protein